MRLFLCCYDIIKNLLIFTFGDVKLKVYSSLVQFQDRLIHWPSGYIGPIFGFHQYISQNGRFYNQPQ